MRALVVLSKSMDGRRSQDLPTTPSGRSVVMIRPKIIVGGDERTRRPPACLRLGEDADERISGLSRFRPLAGVVGHRIVVQEVADDGVEVVVGHLVGRRGGHALVVFEVAV